MTETQKIETLKKCFEDVVWMAVRYAHGRMTYAPPHMVRDAGIVYKVLIMNLKKQILFL